MESGLVDVEKKTLRQHFSAGRKALSGDERRNFDAAICQRISSMPLFQSAHTVAAFIRLGAEPDLSALFCGKQLLLPRFNSDSGVYEMVAAEDLKRDLLPGKFGIPEPLPTLPAVDSSFLASQVLFLVPAVACDRFGNRLGRGGGFYDRLLSGVKVPPVAVIYSCQLSETPLPGTGHDVSMGWVVTEREVINCAGYFRRNQL